MTPRARLVCPALRWRRGSFKSERTKIEQALAAGVGGFILFGGTRGAVTALTSALRDMARRPLLLGSDFERGPGQQVKGLTELPPPAALGYPTDLAARYAAGLDGGLRGWDAGVCALSGSGQVRCRGGILAGHSPLSPQPEGL